MGVGMANRNLFGRTVIYSAYDIVDRDNLLEILETATGIHQQNQSDIQYLYDYYRGKQPVLDRVKTTRPEIQNNVVVNRANEIVSFKVGYLMGEPIQYVNRGSDEYAEMINNLNEYMFAEEKASKDKELADWFTICGTSYRMVMPDAAYNAEEDEAPFEIYTLDPRNTFVVYHSGVGHKPLMGVMVITTVDNETLYCGYTATHYFEVLEDAIVKWEPHTLNGVPIIEYPANLARLGEFEIVLPLLDAINTIESNRVDDIEEIVQSLLVFKGVDIEDETFRSLRAMGAMKVPLDGDVYFISHVINQGDTQVLVNDIYNEVLTICGMPNRNGGSSTSDTGIGVIYRDGWQNAEARAKDSEMIFKRSEKEFLKLVLRIIGDKTGSTLRIGYIEPQFTRRNYENIQEKANVLIGMLNNDKIHPRLAFEHSGMFVDPDLAYTISEEYMNGERERETEELNDINTELAEAEKAELNV